MIRLFLQTAVQKILLLAVFQCVTFSAYASLSGSYTIDGTKSASGSNYRNFTSAVGDLLSGTRTDGGSANGSGISGAVVFKVADGTYNEQISVSAITGASATNTISFQSASGDSSKVILTYPSSSSSLSNYAIQLSGGNYISFSQITISRTGTNTYGTVIAINNTACYNRFTSCRIIGTNNTSTSNTSSLVYSGTDNDSNNLFQGNLMRYGSYGFYYFGINSTSQEGNTRIIGNTMDSVYYMAAFLYYESSLEFSGNTITNISYQYAYGIYCYYCSNGLKITKNNINMPNGGNYGMYMYNCNGTTLNRALVSDNMLSMGGTNQVYGGIYSYYCSYQDIYYNSILLTNTNVASYGFYTISFNASATDNIINNSVANTGGGMAMYVYYYDVNTLDHNNWYATGSTLGTWNGTNYSNLTQWQTACSKDVNSISANPYYYSGTNLHTSSPLMNGKAVYLGPVSDDIDGESRSSGTPDIGADEFTPPTNDAGITSIVNPSGGYCAGTKNIIVNLTDFGGANLTSAKINWSVNGVLQTSYNWTGSLASAGVTAVTIGTYTFAASSTYKVKAWTSVPNSSTDGNSLNDTITVNNIKQGLNGIYTIGGATPDYASFSAAVAVLNTQGICGATIFNVRNGTYNEQVSIGQVPNSSNVNTITFQSQSGDSSKVILVNLSGGVFSSNYTLQLNGSDYLTFKQITIQRNGNVANFYGRVIDIRGGACNNTFTGCRVWGLNSPYYYYNHELIYSGQDNDSANHFTGNLIRGGTYGFYWYGSSTASKETGTVILNNTIDSTLGYGNYFYYQDGLLIKNNSITNISTGSNSYSAYGLYIYYTDNIKEISKNYIYLLGASSNTYGLQIYYSYNTSASPARIYNNMITAGGNAQYGTYGIYEYGSQYHNYYFNSVNIPSANNNSFAMYAYDFAGQLNLVNNCFINKGGGQAGYVYGAYVGTMNYNDWWTNGSVLGTYSFTAYSSLATWKTASGKDANSVSVDPLFASISNLHVSSVKLDKAATPIGGISSDFDGEARNATTPDIGADEFTPLHTDAGVMAIDSPSGGYCVGIHGVVVNLMNFGSDTLKTATINWSVNGTLQTAFSWTGVLSPGNLNAVTLGTYSFLTGSTYSIKAWTSAPNGISDSNAINDTSLIINLKEGLKGTYTIGGATPDYINFSLAATDLMNRGVCGAVIFNARSATYNEQVFIKAIPNTSPVNTVTFQSQVGDSSQVIMTYNSGTFPNNYTLQLNGASYVTFKNMTFQRSGINFYGTVIELKGGSCNNHFLNNQVLGTRYLSTTNYNSLVYSATDLDSGNWFKNNLMLNGVYGFYWMGSSTSSLEQGTVIQGNILDSNYYAGMFLYYQSGLIVKSNIIRNLTYSITSGSSVYGVYLNYCNNALNVSWNNIYLPYDGFGMYINNCNSTVSSPANIFNNFINVAGTNTSYGIYSYSNTYHNYYFNNVLMTNDQPGSYAFYEYSFSKNVNILNNCIYNSGGGYAMYVGNSSGIARMNFNNFFSSGRFLGYWSGTNAASLAAWKTTSKMDTNSISVNPYYHGPTDLHVFNPALNAAALYYNIATSDFDRDIRNLATPDIGADEFNPQTNDAGIVSIDNPKGNYCTGSTSILATLVNFGTGTLTSANVSWTVNGTSQTPFSWTGSLAPGASASVTVGSYSWVSGSTYDVKIYTDNPNSGIDGDHRNDTTTIIKLPEGMLGTYTIGGSSPDYATFTTATTDLNHRGLCGNVTFNARNGTYKEQIIIDQYPKADKYTAVFQSENNDSTLVNLTYPSDWISNNLNYTVLFQGADNITFRKMTISRTGLNYYGRVFEIRKGANRNRFQNNIIQGARPGYYYYPGELIYSNNNALDTNYIISNNLMRNGTYGIYFYGTFNSPDKSISIQNNLFDSIYNSAIYAYYMDSVIITGNQVKNIQYNQGNGIYIYYPSPTTLLIYKNKIYMPQGGYGIYVGSFYGTAAGKKGLVYNNMVSVGGSSGYSQGISLNNCNYMNCYYNNVLLNSTLTQGRAGYFGNLSQLKLHNNNFVNMGGSEAIEMTNAATNFASSDNNNYFTSGTQLGTLGGALAFNLADWKKLSSKDTNSISALPFYTSKTDLHVKCALLDSAARPQGGITDDIDGDLRNTTRPDIGADEINITLTDDIAMIGAFSPQNGACPNSPARLGVIILNNGTKTQKNIPVTAVLTGGVSATLSATYTKALVPKAYDTVFFASTITSSGASISVLPYASLSTDMDHTNDTFPFKATIMFKPSLPKPGALNSSRCSSGKLKLGVTSAYKGLTNTWYTSDTGKTVIATGDTFTTPLIKTNTTYYVESNGNENDTISTLFNGNYGFMGMMFDVVSLSAISVDSFDINIAGTAADTVEVYYKVGTHKGFEFTKASWKLLGKKYITAKGAGLSTRLPVGSLSIPAGKTYGFYIRQQSSSNIRGTNGSNSYSNFDMIVNPGTGLYSFFNSWTYPYSWNGRIYYNTLGCPSNRAPVTATITHGMKGSDFVKGTTFNASFDSGTVTNPDIICPGNTATYELKPPTGYFNSNYNSKWSFSTVKIATAAGTVSNDTSFSNPNAFSNGILTFTPNTASGDSLFIITVTVSDSSKTCDSTLTRYVYVSPKPKASFSSSAGCLNDTTSFTNKGIYNALSNTSYTWDFGDSTTSAIISPKHKYLTGGPKNIMLKVTSTCGVDSTSTGLTFAQPPKAWFGSTSVCSGDSVYFTDSSTIASGTVNGWKWYFGDGGISSLKNPAHFYSVVTTYTVSLVSTSSTGCKDSVVRVITPNNKPPLSLQAAKFCFGDSTRFDDTSSAASIKSYGWNFGDGNTSNLKNPSHLYSATGTYTVKLKVLSNGGCSGTDSLVITINPLPLATAGGNNSVCAGSSITLGAIATSGHNYSWRSNPSGFSSTAANPLVFPAVNTTYYLADSISATGCAATDSAKIGVNPIPIANAGNDTGLCPGSTITMGSTSISGHTYSWTSTPSGFTSTISNPSVTVSTAGKYFVTETISATTCSASDSINVTVKTITKGLVAKDTTVCKGQTVTIGKAALPGFNYSWTSLPSGFTSTLANPTDNPSASTTYYISYYDSSSGCSVTDSIHVTVNPLPVPNAGIGSSVCMGTGVSLGGSSVSGHTYLWSSNPAGFSSALSSPSVTPLNSTTYYLKDSITATGCMATDSVVIKTIPLPVATAGSDVSICSGSFGVLGSVAVPKKGYSWTSSPSGFVNLMAKPSVLPTVNTTYYLTVKDSVTLCTNTDTVVVTVNPLPSASVGSGSSICKGQSLNIGATAATGNTYLWSSKPAGFSSTSSNPLVNPAITTTYYLTEKVTSTSCKKSDSVIITVNPLPTPNAGSDATICAAKSVNIGMIPISGHTYSWTSSPSGYTSTSAGATVSPTTSTTYYLSETISASSCSSTDTVLINVNALPTVSAGSSLSSCISTLSLTMTGASPAKGVWRGTGITDSVAGTFKPSTAGTGSHALTYYFVDSTTGCANSAGINMYVSGLPTVSFTADTAGCQAKAVSFTNTSSGDSLNAWTFGDGNSSSLKSPSNTYSSRGKFSIQLISTNAYGCRDSSTASIKIDTAATPSFTGKDTICSGNTITFKNNSTGTITSWSWDFGNGDTSNVMNPSEKFSSLKDTVYTVTLKARNGCGASNISSPVVLISRPSAVFSISPKTACGSTAVSVTDKSSGTITSWSWNFGNSLTASGKAPSSTSYTAGSSDQTFRITLTASNLCGTDTVSNPILIYANTVKAGITANVYTGYVPLKVNFSDRSLKTGNKSVSYDYGDGNNGPDSFHTYKTSGTFTVKQIVTNGCTNDTAYLSIYVRPAPIVMWSGSNQACLNAQLNFKNITNDTSTSVWDFGDGATSTLDSPTHIYSKPGKFIVKLMATTVLGFKGTFRDTVTVYDLPNVAFYPDTLLGCSFKPVKVRKSSPTDSYNWDFGDSTTGTGNNPSHIYKTENTFLIKLVATSNHGCIDSAVYPAKIGAGPQSSFSMGGTSACKSPVTVNLSNTSINATTYLWNFGNKTYSIQPSPAVNFDTPGVYSIRLISKNPNGCVDTSLQKFTVNPFVKSDFTANNKQVCMGQPFTFFNKSSSTASTFLWTFGDGDSSTVVDSVAHKYSKTGVYDVALIAMAKSGCTDTLLKQKFLTVHYVPVADFTSDLAQDPFYKGYTQFRTKDSMVTKTTWEFGDNSPEGKEINPQHYYSHNGPYPVRQIVESKFGCKDTIIREIFVDFQKRIFVPTAINLNSDVLENTIFMAKGLGIREYTLTVFNRWGAQVYMTEELRDHEPSGFWDCRFNGNLVPRGQYLWFIEGHFTDGTAFKDHDVLTIFSGHSK